MGHRQEAEDDLAGSHITVMCFYLAFGGTAGEATVERKLRSGETDDGKLSNIANTTGLSDLS